MNRSVRQALCISALATVFLLSPRQGESQTASDGCAPTPTVSSTSGRADTLHLRGEPGGFVVFPIGDGGRAGGAPVVEVHAPFSLLGGPESGTVGESGLRTLAIPQDAPAGRREAVVFRFQENAASRHVHIEIAPRPEGLLLIEEPLLELGAGEVRDLPFRLRNLGNAEDTFAIAVDHPEGWRVEVPIGADGGGSPRALAIGAEEEGVMRILAPLRPWSGDQWIHLRLIGPEGETRGEPVQLRVRGRAPASLRAGGGPTLRTGLSTVIRGDGDIATPALDFALAGEVHGVEIDGRITRALGDPPSMRGFSGVGTSWNPGYLTLQRGSSRLTVGSSRMDLSPLTGMNVFGEGVALHYEGDRVRTGWIGGRPQSTGRPTGESRGRFLAGEAGVRIGRGWVDLSLSDLDEEGLRSRELSAVELSGSFAPSKNVSTEAGVAHRRSRAGDGVGWRGELHWNGPWGSFLLSGRDAPGGYAAFANGEAEWHGSLVRRFGPLLALEASGSGARDAGSLGISQEMWGWMAGPVLSGRAGGGGSLRLFQRDFRSGAEDHTLGLREEGIRAEGRLGHRDLLFTLATGWTVRERETGRAAEGNRIRRGDGFDARLTARWARSFGTLRSGAGFERNDPGLGRLPEQWNVSAGAQDLRILRRLPTLLLNVGLDHYRSARGAGAFTTFSFGGTGSLPAGFRLRVNLEYNPLYGLGDGREREVWGAAIRVEHRSPLPLPSGWRDSRSRRYRVFLDRNGNGVADEGEPGISGIRVGVGNERKETGSSGEVAFGMAGEPLVDLSSIPPDHLLGRIMGDGTIPIVPVSEFRLHLLPGTDGFGRGPELDFPDLRVRLRNERGENWSVTPDDRGLARFPSLPPGRYDYIVEIVPGRESTGTVEGERGGFEVRDAGERIRREGRVLPRPLSFSGGDSPSPLSGAIP